MRNALTIIAILLATCAAFSTCDRDEINLDIQAYTGKTLLPGLQKRNQDLKDIAP